MSKDIYIVAYEGESASSNVLDYAGSQAKKDQAEIVLVHVLEWSPYTFLTPEELEERHSRRKQELARAHSAITEPALNRLKDAGVSARAEIRYGSVVDLIVEIAKEFEASMIFVGRSGSGSSSIAARVFGSVPMGLAQVAPVPTVIVP